MHLVLLDCGDPAHYYGHAHRTKQEELNLTLQIIYEICLFLLNSLPVFMLNHADSLYTPSQSMLSHNTCIIITIIIVWMFLLKLNIRTLYLRRKSVV